MSYEYSEDGLVEAASQEVHVAPSWRSNTLATPMHISTLYI